MSSKVIKQGTFQYDITSLSFGEFEQRMKNLDNCINNYIIRNQDIKTLRNEKTRVDIERTCSLQLDLVKDFVNMTKANYFGIYAEKTQAI